MGGARGMDPAALVLVDPRPRVRTQNTSYFFVLPVVFSLLLISGVFMPLFFGACLTCAVLCVMGYTMVYRRRDDEAEPLCRRALEISEQIYGPNHPKIATCLNNLATQVRRCN